MKRRRPLLSLLLIAATAATLLSLSAYQTTSETAASRLLGRLFAAMIEAERWLAVHESDLRERSRERERGVIVVEALPVRVELRAAEVASASGDSLLALLTLRAGERLYDDGLGAFANGPSGGRLAIDEPARWTVLGLGRESHSAWTLLLAASAASAALVLLLVGMSTTQPLRTATGAVVIGAGVAALVAGAIWLVCWAAAGALQAPVDREIALILRDSAWIGVRNGLAVLVAALAIRGLVELAASQSYRQGQWPGALDGAG